MLQLISGSTRRKANKCEPLLSRAGKEMEHFPACTRAPGSLGRSSVDIWTASLQWDCIIIPEWNSIPRHQVGGGIKSGSGVERVDYWETMTMTFDKQWAKLRETPRDDETPREEEIRLTSTGDRGSRRNLGNPDEAAAASAEWKSLRQVASLGGQTPGGRPHGTQCGERFLKSVAYEIQEKLPKCD